MEIIRPSFQILAMTGHSELPYQYQPNPELLIEAAGRTCYKSEDKITEGSAKKFMEGIVKRKHFTVLEHSWEVREYDFFLPVFQTEPENWHKYLYVSEKNNFIAGSIRAWLEAEIQNDTLKYYSHRRLTEKEIIRWACSINNEPFLMRASVRFIVDRGVSHEMVRHRPPGISQESTRYCDYSKKGIQFIIPKWCDLDEGVWDYCDITTYADFPSQIWFRSMLNAEDSYQKLIAEKWLPQQARSVLPNSLKTELVVTATLQEWQHIFRQRALGLTGKPHPQMEEIMVPTWKDFERLEPQFFSEKVLRS